MKPLKKERFILQAHYDALDDIKAKAILDHAEKLLKDTIDGAGLIVNRLTALASIVSTLIVALTGYALSRAADKGFTDANVQISLLSAVYLYLPAVAIVWNLCSKLYYAAGAAPKVFFVPTIFEKRKGEELKAIYFQELLDIQARIDANQNRNKWRWRSYNAALILTLLTPGVMFLAYYIIHHLAAGR